MQIHILESWNSLLVDCDFYDRLLLRSQKVEILPWVKISSPYSLKNLHRPPLRTMTDSQLSENFDDSGHRRPLLLGLCARARADAATRAASHLH